MTPPAQPPAQLRAGTWNAPLVTHAPTAMMLIGHGEFETELLRRFFLRRGCAIAATSRWDHAIYAAVDPDVVLIGSEGDATDVLRALRRSFGAARAAGAVALVPAGRHEDALRALDAGADLTLFAPLDLDVMCGQLQALVRRARA